MILIRTVSDITIRFSEGKTTTNRALRTAQHIVFIRNKADLDKMSDQHARASIASTLCWGAYLAPSLDNPGRRLFLVLLAM